MKEFNSFDEMMEDQQGARPEDFAIPWGDHDFEIVGDYIAIYAHSESTAKALNFAKENGLHALTEVIGENDNDETVFGYIRGLSWVNRERYFFTKKDDDFCFDEVV